jgi:long-chain acyl-CoA synthetase
VVFWGVLLSGAAVVPVNTRLTGSEAAHLLTDSGAALVLDDPEALPAGEAYADLEIGPADLAAVFYTSGTTGRPKGAATTHANFASHAETSRRVKDVERDSPTTRVLISVPLFHVTGCNGQLLLAAVVGGAAVIMPTFSAGEFLAAVERERIDVMTTVPAVYWLVLQHPALPTTDTSSVRTLLYGGAPMAPELIRRLRAAFPTARLGNGFGMTEAFCSTFLPDALTDDHPDSVGLPTPLTDVALHEPDPATGIGEIMFRGGHVVSGYWGLEEATREAFRVDGWYLTGDLGRIDDDGLVYALDRKKDLINRGGENVYCVEIENVLVGHPALVEASVVGVPDPVMGEKVGVVLVARPGQSVEVASVLDFCRERLADYKIPEFVAVLEERLPRTASGKVDKKSLRAEQSWTPVGREARRLQQRSEGGPR